MSISRRRLSLYTASGRSAFRELIKTGEYDAIFDRNRHHHENKWNVTWIAHKHGALTFASHLDVTEQ